MTLRDVAADIALAAAKALAQEVVKAVIRKASEPKCTGKHLKGRETSK